MKNKNKKKEVVPAPAKKVVATGGPAVVIKYDNGEKYKGQCNKSGQRHGRGS
jgi:hypothetical protein